MVQLQLVEHLLLAAVAGQAALVVVLVLRPLFPEDQEVLTVVEVEARVVAIVNEELMVQFVLSGPDVHAPSHQLVLEHLNFLEKT